MDEFQGLPMSHKLQLMSLFSYLRVDALDPGALAAAAVVGEALVDVVAVEAVPSPPDRAMPALSSSYRHRRRHRRGPSQTSSS